MDKIAGPKISASMIPDQIGERYLKHLSSWFFAVVPFYYFDGGVGNAY